MLSSIASMCHFSAKRGSRIHPENITTTPRSCTPPTPTPTTRKEQSNDDVYAKYKEQGAYDKYRQTLLSG